MSAGTKFDNEKLRYDLVDPLFIEGLTSVLTFGANKYDDNNWKKLDNGINRYYAALLRHIQAWRKGESIDEESKRLHLHHAACCLMFILGLERQNEKTKTCG